MSLKEAVKNSAHEQSRGCRMMALLPLPFSPERAMTMLSVAGRVNKDMKIEFLSNSVTTFPVFYALTFVALVIPGPISQWSGRHMTTTRGTTTGVESRGGE